MIDFLVTVTVWNALPYERGAGRGGVALNRNVRTEGVSDIEVGGARWTLMPIPAKIAPWNPSMIFLPCITFFVETGIHFSFPVFLIRFCYPFLAQGSWQRPGQESFTLSVFLFCTYICSLLIEQTLLSSVLNFLHFCNCRDLALYWCSVMSLWSSDEGVGWCRSLQRTVSSEESIKGWKTMCFFRSHTIDI